MRMIFKFTIMGMQDGMSTDPSFELWITARVALKSVTAGLGEAASI
jgi:hypothetical protein